MVLNPALSAADAGSEFRIALLSDTHVPGDRKNGYRGFNPWENLQAVVPEVSAIKPQAVILNGDAARLEGKPEDYQEVKSLLEPLASVAPIYLSLGNHDDRANFPTVVTEDAEHFAGRWRVFGADRNPGSRAMRPAR